jgi:hypothetical protein
VRLIHLAHAARANMCDDFVGTQFGARRDCHKAPVSGSGESIQLRGNLQEESEATKPSPGKSGGLNRSVQHLLGVYLPEFEIPKFFLDADLSAALPHRDQLVNALTSLFV